MAFRRRLRIAIVVTRNLSENNGRTPILSHIARTLGSCHQTEMLRLLAIVESRDIRDIAGAFLVWAWSVLHGRPLPLQCVLYASPRQCRRLVAHIRDRGCDAVYLDTVRCQHVLRLLRHALPDLHIVTDFDDLMSRRARYLLENRLPFAAGHVGRHFPNWLQRLVEGVLAPAIASYEARTLPVAEADVVALSDATVLLSAADRAMLHAATRAETLHAVLPAVMAMRAPRDSVAPQRFVFIGSDSFIQNRTAIDFLLETWRSHRPPLPLHIYGRQSRAPAMVPGVHWHGFVDDLAQVYEPGSIALVPALDRGGIKTKMLEAWAWGCPALGNHAAIDGMAISHYPLVLPEAQWLSLLADPQAHRALWAQGAHAGHSYVRDCLSARHFEQAWQAIMHPDAPIAIPQLHVVADATAEAREPVPDFARTA